jgi:hypothetical protein
MPAASGCRLANDFPSGRDTLNVAGAHGVPVHLRAIERRQIRISDDVRGQKATARLLERNSFAGQYAGLLANDVYGVSDGNHLGLLVRSWIPACRIRLHNSSLTLNSGSKIEKRLRFI